MCKKQTFTATIFCNTGELILRVDDAGMLMMFMYIPSQFETFRTRFRRLSFPFLNLSQRHLFLDIPQINQRIIQSINTSNWFLVPPTIGMTSWDRAAASVEDETRGGWKWGPQHCQGCCCFRCCGCCCKKRSANQFPCCHNTCVDSQCTCLRCKLVPLFSAKTNDINQWNYCNLNKSIDSTVPDVK